MDKKQWVNSYIETLSKSNRLNSNGRVILDLHNRLNKTNVQEKMLNSIIDGEYKAYLAKLYFEKAKKNAGDKAKFALDAIKKSQLAGNKQNRKKREHELITIGALTDTVGFEKDRGLIAGSMLYIIDRINEHESFRFELKERGDKFLHERELQKKSKADNNER
jgi:hypothetical protein